MSSPTVFEELRKSGFFSEVSADDLKKLADLCQIVEFPANKTIFEQYALAHEVYVIVSGEISLAICEPAVSCRQISLVHAGELMGWSPLVGRARLYDSARTTKPVKALAFDGQELMKFCGAIPRSDSSSCTEWHARWPSGSAGRGCNCSK